MPRFSGSQAAMGVRKPIGRSKISNGSVLLPGVDGRNEIARRYRDIAAQIIVDQGGFDRLAEARLQLIRRFAACSVMAEQMEGRLANGEEIDISQHAMLCGSLVRVAARIGINRRAREILPSLTSYLQQQSADTDIDPDTEDEALE